jgi:hypothetical protein
MGVIYLWVPTLAAQLGLVQVYLLPAVLTVLLLLQLHRRELKPSVLNNVRLATLSTLYTAATLQREAILQRIGYGGQIW